MRRKAPAQLNPKSLKYYRARGYLAEVVERTIPKTYIKKDLYSCFDILAIGNGEIVFCQVTTMPNRAARLKKITIENKEVFDKVLESNGVIEIHAWKKLAYKWVVTVSRYGGESGEFRQD